VRDMLAWASQQWLYESKSTDRQNLKIYRNIHLMQTLANCPILKMCFCHSTISDSDSQILKIFLWIVQICQNLKIQQKTADIGLLGTVNPTVRRATPEVAALGAGEPLLLPPSPHRPW